MAKMYGLQGVVTGKLANTVMSVRFGEQIARKYQPVVFNPSTSAQVEVRAKLKLMSQLGAILGPYIAIPRQGAVSPRNLFTKKNFPATTFSSGQADINLTYIALTDSAVAMPSITINRDGNTMNVTLGSAQNDLDRVTYIVAIKTGATMRVLDSRVVAKEGTGTFPAAFSVGSASNAIVFAYGMRDNTEAARVYFSSLQVLEAEHVAKIVTSRTLLSTDITLTETRVVESAGTTQMSAGNNVPTDENENSMRKKK